MKPQPPVISIEIMVLPIASRLSGPVPGRVDFVLGTIPTDRPARQAEGKGWPAQTGLTGEVRRGRYRARRESFAQAPPFALTLPVALFTVETLHDGQAGLPARSPGEGTVTKKEIVKQISERIGLTQLKTKEIVQQTFDAIVDTLLEVGRIELRNFGVFEVKQRKARKARNPKTGQRVDVPPKNVGTFKPGKEMEERVRRMTHIPTLAQTDEDRDLVGEGANGIGDHDGESTATKVKTPRARKTT